MLCVRCQKGERFSMPNGLKATLCAECLYAALDSLGVLSEADQCVYVDRVLPDATSKRIQEILRVIDDEIIRAMNKSRYVV